MTLKTKNKGNVLRMCIATKERLPKKDLIRIIKCNNKYVIDYTYESKPGKSAYVKKEYAVWNKIKSHKLLHKTFKTKVPDYVYQLLEKELNKYEKKE